MENALSRCFYHNTVIYPGVYRYYVLSHLCFPFLDHFFISSEIKTKKKLKEPLPTCRLPSLHQVVPSIPVPNITCGVYNNFFIHIIVRDVFPENTETNIGLFIYPMLWFIKCVYIFPGLRK